MPFVRIDLFPGRTDEQKANTARAITEALVQHAGCTPQSVQIVFAEVKKSDWATAGVMASAPQPAE
ncbi:tautomerase family protein [Teichococcus oryzae]|uniref:4-oxalocrotonate tautomerase n=1 Tax=Teichococcus oryzae TaxID=1608942 RepID=A0A5B2TKF1_9PROT|nr:4-oxalocrotonate tautomerase [Pseudoroseomonas oryzae]